MTDPENNANLVGSTEGNIHLTLEDWNDDPDRQLDGGGRTLRFCAGPPASQAIQRGCGRDTVLEWGSVPRHGGLACQIRHPRQRPTAPGKRLDGVQNEDIDVILHLNGPMLRPNIGFDLDAPRAPSIVAEALATAVVDDAERTRQAIALLSLQEFLPQQINTLELGTTGLQEYSIDMVTSQLSNWLSKINEDIDVGIRYDASSALNPASVNQDAYNSP